MYLLVLHVLYFATEKYENKSLSGIIESTESECRKYPDSSSDCCRGRIARDENTLDVFCKSLSFCSTELVVDLVSSMIEGSE